MLLLLLPVTAATHCLRRLLSMSMIILEEDVCDLWWLYTQEGEEWPFAPICTLALASPRGATLLFLHSLNDPVGFCMPTVQPQPLVIPCNF